MFSAVENKEIVVPDLGKPVVPFTHENLGKIQRFKPVLDKDELTIYWILPYCELEFKSQPLQYFSHLFGHEGENSLLSYLKKEDQAMSLSSGCDHELGVFSDFYITIGLTQKGLKETDAVLQTVFKYAQRLVEAGPQDFVFNECNSIGTIKFDYADKGSAINYCVSITRKMPLFDKAETIPHILRHKYIADDFDK
jgi:insulysin